MIYFAFFPMIGVDFLGRPVVVFVSRHFPANSVDLNKVSEVQRYMLLNSSN